MIQGILTVVLILLAIYGLSVLVSDLILWLSSSRGQHTWTLLIPVKEEKSASAIHPEVRERLKRCGLWGLRIIYLTDTHDLPEENEEYEIHTHNELKEIL